MDSKASTNKTPEVASGVGLLRRPLHTSAQLPQQPVIAANLPFSANTQQQIIRGT